MANIKMQELKKKLFYDKTVMLEYTIVYPFFYDEKENMNLINSFVELEKSTFEKNCQINLYKEAVSDYEYRKERKIPFHPYEANLIFTITYHDQQYISYYFDNYQYTGGAHGNTIRKSETWDTLLGKRIRLDMIDSSQNYVVSKEAIIYQINQNKDIYFPDADQLVYKTFNEKQFYFDDEQLILYFQQYDIAPYATGIPTFSFSLKKEK